MLAFFREIQHSFFIKIILGLTALSFVSLFGVSSYLQPNRENETVAVIEQPKIKIGFIKLMNKKTKITVSQIRTELDDEMARMKGIYGSDFNMQEAIKSGILKSLIERVVSRTVINKAVDDMGISISDSSLKRETYNTSLFHNEQGVFDRGIFQQMLRISGMSEGQYFRTLKNDVARNHLLAGASSNPPVSKLLAQNIYKYRNEKRIVDIINLDASKEILSLNKNKISTKPDEKTLAEYYENNKHLFINPEYRKLTAIYISPQTITKQIVISDDDAKEIYESEINAYSTPEERKVSQMLFDNEIDALVAKKLIEENKSFLEVAKEKANQTKEETELGWVTTDTLIFEMNDLVFNAAKNDVVGPMQTQFGWHIMKVEDIKTKTITPFKDVKDEIIANIKNEKALDRIYNDARTLEDLLGRGATLEEASETGGFELTSISQIDSNGLSNKGKAIDNDVLSPLFLQKAFDLFEGEESLLIEDENSMFVVRVDEIIDSTAKELSEVKNEIIKLWEKDQYKKIARSNAENILADIEKGKKIASAAKEWNLTVKKSPAFTRTDSNDVPLEIVSKAFALDNNKPELVSLENGFAVIVLNKIISANPETDAVGVSNVAKKLEENIAEDLKALMIAGLSQQYIIRINQDVIDKNF